MADEGSQQRRRAGRDGAAEAAAEQAARPGMLSKLLLVLAVVLMAAGVTFGLLASDDEPPTAPPPPAAQQEGGAGEGAGALAPSGFLPDTRPGAPGGESTIPAESAEVDATDAAARDWSDGLFRLGFSFFIGFAIAFALRSFIKLSLVAVGFFAMALLGMQYAGFIEVNWTLIGDRYDDAGQWLAGQFSSARAFVTGELPSAAGVVAGFALGFRSRR